MSEWQECKLGDVVITNAKSLDKSYTFETILYLDTGSITEGKIESFQEISLKDAPSRAKRLAKPNDIVYSTVRPIQRHYGLLKKPQPNLVVSTGFTVIEANQKFAHPEFIYYLLSSDESVEYLDVIAEASTSTYPSLKPSDIENLDISLPPIEEQKAIASVLSSLDDKIDLLHRQNTTLESMAETVFRQCFLEEAHENWDELPLGEVATVQNGYAFSSGNYEEYQEGFLEVFKMGHIQPGGGLRFNPKADFVPRTEKLKRWTLNKNDIVMAMTDMKDNMGILGHPALIDVSDKYVLNQRVARIYLENTEKLKSNYLLYLQMTTEEAISLLQSKANSGVQVNLTTEAIKSIPISLPPKFVQDKVLSNIEPIFNKLSSNRLAVKTLEKLRDNLLPKLMSGEVRVY